MSVPSAETDNPVRTATTIAGAVANPIVMASLASVHASGCPLPPGPYGALRLLETLSYVTVAGIVFSWTPSQGSFGSAGLDIAVKEEDAAEDLQHIQESRISFTGIVEASSWIVFVVGFGLLVVNIVAPTGDPGFCAER